MNYEYKFVLIIHVFLAPIVKKTCTTQEQVVHRGFEISLINFNDTVKEIVKTNPFLDNSFGRRNIKFNKFRQT